MGPKLTGSEPEVGRKWNARDLQAQGACALRFFKDINDSTIDVYRWCNLVVAIKIFKFEKCYPKNKFGIFVVMRVYN